MLLMEVGPGQMFRHDRNLYLRDISGMTVSTAGDYPCYWVGELDADNTAIWYTLSHHQHNFSYLSPRAEVELGGLITCWVAKK